MTTQTEIQEKFYPLQIKEWLESIEQLTYSEVKILYYLKAIDNPQILKIACLLRIELKGISKCF